MPTAMTYSAEETRQTKFTHRFTVQASELTASGATQTIALITLQPGQMVGRVAIGLPTAFVSSDATLTSTAITVGDSGSATRYLSSTELNAAGTPVTWKGGTNVLNAYTTATAVNVYFTGTSAKALNTHTAGTLQVFVDVVDLTTID